MSRCRMALKISGETSLSLARRASQEIQEGNIEAEKGSLAKGERSAGRHLSICSSDTWLRKSITMQQQEKDLTKTISDVLEKEQSVEKEKSETEIRLSYERNELSDLQRDLNAAEDRLRSTNNRRTASAVGAGVAVSAGVASIVLTIVTAGLAAPVAVPAVLGTASVVGGATAGGLVVAVADAQSDIDRIRKKIEDTEAKIRQSESEVHSLSRVISQLSSQKSSYMTQRSNLQEEKGKMKEVIVFLLDAKMYGNKFSIATSACVHRTALTGKLSGKVETRGFQGYSLFDSRGTKRVLATFEEAWNALEEMTANGVTIALK